MRLRYISALPALAGLALWMGAPALTASDQRYPIGRSSNDIVEISANLLLDKDEIKQAIGSNIAGSDLGGNIVVVRVTVRPLGDDPVKVWLDDFMLLSDKDGQRAEPFEPSQIAGAGAIMVKDASKSSSTTVLADGPSGTMMGMPTGGPMMGNGISAHPSADIEIKDAKDTTDSPLLVALRRSESS